MYILYLAGLQEKELSKVEVYEVWKWTSWNEKLLNTGFVIWNFKMIKQRQPQHMYEKLTKINKEDKYTSSSNEVREPSLPTAT